MDQRSLLQLLGQLQNLEPPIETAEQPATAAEEVKEDSEQAPEASTEAANDEEAVGEPEEQEEEGALLEETTTDAPEPDLDTESATNTELERLLASLVPLDPSAYSTPAYPDYPEYPTASSTASYAEFTSYPFDPEPPAIPTPPIFEEPPDIRKYTFAQALPVVSKLSEDPSFIEQLQQIKSDQEAFELSILDERNKAKAELEKQLKQAQDKAKHSGMNYEVDRILKLLNSANTKFDKQALVRWDTLAKDQQARLEKLGVPCFYVLKNPDAIASERQRKVMEILTTLLSDA